MRNKNTRKGFTTVELVIVIAVIAILATVLIPTFSNMIEKANLSADTQNVRNMNMVLATYMTDGEPEHFGVLRKRLMEGGYKTGEEFLPKTAGHKYFWYVDRVDRNNDGILEDISVILLVDEENKVIYPKEYIDVNILDNEGRILVRKFFDLNLPAMEVKKYNTPEDIVASTDGKIQGVPTVPLNLAIQYTFEDNEETSAKYGDWKTTFYVSCDLPDGCGVTEIDIPLAGYYQGWMNKDGDQIDDQGQWKLCLLEDLKEGEEIDILRRVGVGDVGLTYAEVQKDIGTFKCGVVDAKNPSASDSIPGELLINKAFDGDYDPAPAGTVLTVELRLTNDETGEIAVAGIFRYTFQ